MKRFLALIFAILALASGCYKNKVEVAAPEPTAILLTSIPVVEAICKELTQQTDIKMLYIGDANTTLQELPEYYKLQSTLLDSLAKEVTAVVGLRSIIEEDRLFLEMRNRKIHIIEIDAASSLNPAIASIGLSRDDNSINPYIWLSISNVQTMAELISSDLEKLFPEQSQVLSQNFHKLHTELGTLKNQYNRKFISLPAFEAATMDNAFHYFISDINLFITSRFPNESEWDSTTTALYKSSLKKKRFSTILHRWEPYGEIAKEAKEAGISFTTPNLGTPKMDSFDKGIVSFMEANLEALYKNLAK